MGKWLWIVLAVTASAAALWHVMAASKPALPGPFEPDPPREEMMV